MSLNLKFEFLLSTRISGSVEKIIFDQNYFAVSDSTFAVTIFKINRIEMGDANAASLPEFQYLGRSRLHTSKIVSMDIFENVLITIGYDRYMVEYDLNSLKYEGEQSTFGSIREPSRLEQTARPLAAIIHPEIESKSNEKFLLTVTDQHKLRLFNIKTRLARKMTLAPICGAAINDIKVIPKQNLLAFSAGSKIGLILLPADGNPWKQTAILAHPSGVDSINISHCGNFLFSLAKNTKNHGCLQCWEVNKKSLEAQLALCPPGIEPYISLMENNRKGQLFNNLKTYFYYASLLEQKIQTSEQRQIYESLPLKYLPDILRACGLYPSEKEVEDMSNEVLFWKYGTGETSSPNAEITLSDVVQLYVNYQHVDQFGHPIDQRRLYQEAIQNLNLNDTGKLLEMVQTTSEAIPEAELADRLACLGSIVPEGVEQEWPKSYLSGEDVEFARNLNAVIPRMISGMEKLIFKQ